MLRTITPCTLFVGVITKQRYWIFTSTCTVYRACASSCSKTINKKMLFTHT